MSVIRLDKFISEQAVVSRKSATKIIYSGHVCVDHTVNKDPSTKIDPEKVIVSFYDRELVYRKHLYIMLNKPAGILCVSKDPKMSTVLDLLPNEWRRPGLFPAGRLDKDTTGLVLITDDGDWAHKLLSPKNEIWKTYEAVIDKPITQEIITAFEEGTTLPDGTPCHPAKLSIIQDGNEPLVQITICEGKYHQIKRMFGTHDCGVNSLKRTAIGTVKLDVNLKEGSCRLLTPGEQNDIFC